MNFMNFPILKTDRLLLRGFTLDDSSSVQKLAGEKEIADTTLLIPHPYPDGAAEEWISTHQEKFESGEEIVFAITSKETNELIGAIGITINRNFNNGEIGYWVGIPFWNKGYCTEAVGEIIRFGFEDLKLNRIHAHHFMNNPSSGRVMLKNGMKEEGILREHIRKNGFYEDIKMYGILMSEFTTKKKH